MQLAEAVSTCFAKYATFSGRAVRSEYWNWILFTVIAGIVFAVIEVIISKTLGTVLAGIFNLGTILPSIAVACRRLHDIDRSGWWQLLVFIPILGWLVLLYWFCQPGPQGGNRFG